MDQREIKDGSLISEEINDVENTEFEEQCCGWYSDC